MTEDTDTTSSSSGSATASMGANVPPPNTLRIPPPLLALLCFAGALVIHIAFPGPRQVFAHHILGLLIVSGGVGLCFYAAAIFQARGTTKNPQGEATSFVTEAPYTFTRNPMYLGMTIVLFGLAVFFTSIVMLLAPLAFFIAIDRTVIPLEEANMERLFGASYSDYKTRVRRWL